jgi:hypothetical protein
MASQFLEEGQTYGDLMNSIIQDRQINKLKSILAVYPGFVNKSLDDQGWTPLIYAANHNSLEFASILILEFKANVNQRDLLGWTPLMHVITKQQAEAQLLAQLFCINGANVGATTNLMETAQDFAKELEIMTLALNYYAVKGSYARWQHWHSYKKVLWVAKANKIWGKLPQQLLRETCSFM